MRPAYMTAIVSAISAAIPRSCVTNIIPMPSSRAERARFLVGPADEQDLNGDVAFAADAGCLRCRRRYLTVPLPGGEPISVNRRRDKASGACAPDLRGTSALFHLEAFGKRRPRFHAQRPHDPVLVSRAGAARSSAAPRRGSKVRSRLLAGE